jgi:histidinol-phosphate aminotransferase
MTTEASYAGRPGEFRSPPPGQNPELPMTGPISLGRIAGEPPAGDIVVGIGARRGVGIRDVRMTLGESLATAGVRARDVIAIVTIDAKQAEAAVAEMAELLGVPLRTMPADQLAQQVVPNPSPTAERLVGTPSVAEAAVIAYGAELLMPKHLSRGVTVAVGRLSSRRPVQVPEEDDLGFKDLRHHGDAEVGAGLIDLAVNVYGSAPDWLRSVLRDAVDKLASYPSPEKATAAIAARHGRPPEQVLLTAGGAEAFVLLARALAPRRAVIVYPQFTEPEAALNAAGHTVHRVLLPTGFTLDPSLVPDDADLVIIGNPTNPTSVLHPAQALLALARPGRVLVVDEAFMDAVPGERESLAGRPDQPGPDVPGLVVVRSLTKTWGLAGLRIGYLVGDPELLKACQAMQALWSVGTIGLEAAIACSTPEATAEAEQTANRVVADREYLLGKLAELADVEVVPDPHGPFVLLRVHGPDPAGVHQRLRDDGWAVRRADTFPGLGAGWLRAAVREHSISDAFVIALGRAVLGDAPLTIDLTDRASNDPSLVQPRQEPTS